MSFFPPSLFVIKKIVDAAIRSTFAFLERQGVWTLDLLTNELSEVKLLPQFRQPFSPTRHT